MNARENLPAPIPMLWSQQGQVCCPKHAPYPGSDTWRNDRWRRMRDHEVAAFAAASGLPVECEVCGPRAFARRARPRTP